MVVHIRATWRIELNYPCAAAMLPFVKLLCRHQRIRFSYRGIETFFSLIPRQFCHIVVDEVTGAAYF